MNKTSTCRHLGKGVGSVCNSAAALITMIHCLVRTLAQNMFLRMPFIWLRFFVICRWFFPAGTLSRHQFAQQIIFTEQWIEAQTEFVIFRFIVIVMVARWTVNWTDKYWFGGFGKVGFHACEHRVCIWQWGLTIYTNYLNSNTFNLQHHRMNCLFECRSNQQCVQSN